MRNSYPYIVFEILLCATLIFIAGFSFEEDRKLSFVAFALGVSRGIKAISCLRRTMRCPVCGAQAFEQHIGDTNTGRCPAGHTWPLYPKTAIPPNT